jgi:hypothetical protein
MALMALVSTSAHLSLMYLLLWLPSLRLLQRCKLIASGLRFVAATLRPFRQLYFLLSPHRFGGELLPLFVAGQALSLILGPP